MVKIMLYALMLVAWVLIFTESVLWWARERCYWADQDLNLIEEQYQQLKNARMQREKKR